MSVENKVSEEKPKGFWCEFLCISECLTACVIDGPGPIEVVAEPGLWSIQRTL